MNGMPTQEGIAREIAQWLEVADSNEARVLANLLDDLWERTNASWRNGDTRYSANVVNSLAVLIRAATAKLESLTPKSGNDPFDLKA